MPPHALANSDASQGLRLTIFGVALVLTLSPQSFGLAVGEHELFPPRAFAIGARPTGIASADLDNDGILDLVTSNYYSGFVSVMFGVEGGVFAPAVRIAVGLFASDIELVDLNEDGLKDLAILNGALLVGLNRGDRTFEDLVVYNTVPSGFIFRSLKAAHVNADLHPDLLVGGEFMTVFLGNGDGTLSSVQLSSAGDRFFAPGDYNNDGVLDFATSYSGFGSVVTLWLGNGDGTFASPVSTGVVGYDGVAQDFDRDGNLDLAVAFPGGAVVSILFGFGDGTFADPIVYEGAPRGYFLELADLNDDGHDDLISTSPEATFAGTSLLPEVGVLVSNGDGSFADAVLYRAPALAGPVTSGDFMGDRTDDIAVASHWGKAGPESAAKGALADGAALGFTLAGDGQGGLIEARAEYWVLSAESPSPRSIVTTDFNADGHLDLMTANSGSDSVTIALGQGDGTFVELESISVGASPMSLVVARFDSDVVADAAVANEGSSEIAILLGEADGTFSVGGQIALGRAPVAVVSADFDEDGFADLATANPMTHDVSVVLGRGDGTFEAPMTLGVGDEPLSLVVVDFDGKDGLDLAVVNKHSGDISILPGRGDGTFSTEVRLPTEADSMLAIAAADVNDDGSQDLVVTGNGDPSLWVLYGDGVGGIASERSIEIGGGGYRIAIADIDGNGRLDLLVTHFMALQSVVLGVEGGFASRLEFAGAAFGDIAVGEFNNDGRIDLAVTDRDQHSVALLLNKASVLAKFGPEKSTLSWPILVGYDSFNVYRGVLADLFDSDGDALPDFGYGECRNDLDLDLTDNLFVDHEDPAPGEGFFYLMSRVRDGLESDIGETSTGLPRIPWILCGSKAAQQFDSSQRPVASPQRSKRRER